MQVNLIISATSPAQKKINTTISYLRQSQKSKAQSLAVALNQLTKNVFQSATVNEMNVDPTQSQKEIPTLTLGQWETASGLTYGKVADINYNGDGTLGTSTGIIVTADNKKRLNVGSGATGVLYATEGANYTPAVLEFTAN